jgi:hypothetical protein
MKLLFQLEDQVHTFNVTERLNVEDAVLLKESLFRFFESHPPYTILDLSHAVITAPLAEFEVQLNEVIHFAAANGLNLIVARTAEESASSKQSVLELALQKQLEVLQAKLELREKIRAQAEVLVAENADLKVSMNEQLLKLKILQRSEGPLNPLLEKLWGEK